MPDMKSIARIIVSAVFLVFLGAEISAQEAPMPADIKKALSEKYKGVSYSPYAARDFANDLLWGDSHLHTGLSFDAGAAGCILTPEDAYRFARGEEVLSSFGIPVKLSRPLDWLAVTDHTDNMGFILDLIKGEPAILATEKGKDWHERLKTASKDEKPMIAYEIIKSLIVEQPPTFPMEIYYGVESEGYKSTWESIVKTAEAYNDPGNLKVINRPGNPSSRQRKHTMTPAILQRLSAMNGPPPQMATTCTGTCFTAMAPTRHCRYCPIQPLHRSVARILWSCGNG
jgi:hypothetical protein